MNSFYYGNDQGQDYWINLNHVCFVKPEKDKLILKMSDGTVVGIDGEDYDALKAILISETVIRSRQTYREESEFWKHCQNQQGFSPEAWIPKVLDLGDDDIPF